MKRFKQLTGRKRHAARALNKRRSRLKKIKVKLKCTVKVQAKQIYTFL